MGNEKDGCAYVSAGLLELMRRGEYQVFHTEAHQVRARLGQGYIGFTIYNDATGEAEREFSVDIVDLRALLEIADLSK